VGTILAGFVLIPQMGVRGMAWVLAAALWVVALVHFFLARRFLIDSSILLLGLLLTILHPKPRFEEGVIYQTESLYGQLKVVDVRDDRYLLLDGTPQTVIDKRTGTPLLKYTHYLKFLRLVNPEAESMLLIGLGGGSIASEFQGYGLEVDLVEIDRRMEEVARRFFGFEAKPGSVHFEDGRYYLQHTHKKYDFVLLDVYSGDAIPFHLFTSEVMSSVKSLLKPDGVLTVNLVSFVTGPNSLAAKSVYRTLKRAFPFVDVFFTQGRDRLGNVLFFASPDTIEQRMELTELEDRLDRIAVREMLERRVHFRDDEGVVLTDDYNPLEILTLGISRAWREETHAVLKTQ